MITPNKYFFDAVNSLDTHLSQNVDRKELFDNCVKERLLNVLDVQSKYFDDALAEIDHSISWDLSDAKNIKRLGTVLEDLHKVIVLDRLSILCNLMEISERY